LVRELHVSQIPVLGDAVPQRGNSISRVACRWLFRGLGWRIEGNLPDVPKAVVIVVPHTSNWDFGIGVIAMFALGVRVSFLAKHTLFWWPLGVVMRWLGGLRIDRSSAGRVVKQIIGEFERCQQLVLVVAPEGTRGRVSRWKTGFYRIAQGAELSIVPVSFDYARRTIRFGEPVEPTGDFDSDRDGLEEFFVDVTGRRDR
jgi:1-acyl-sn-glycerol-3-phosphate acyltransferase